MGISERKAKEKQQRRQSILLAAEQIFFDERRVKATMDDVAQKAELSKGTLYLYFKNKDDLMLGIAKKGAQLLTSYLKKATIELSSGIEKLSCIGDAFVQFVKDYPSHFELILKFELFDNKASDDSPEIMKQSLDVLEDSIQQGQQDNTIRKDITPSTLVQVIWSQQLGILHQSLKQSHLNFSEIIKSHYKIVMQGLKP